MSALLALSLAACMGPADKGDKPATGDKAAAKAPKKPAKAEKKKPKKDAKADAKKADAKADDKKAAKKFRKGKPIPKGLPNEDVYAWNKAQGDPIDGEFTLDMAFAGDDKLKDKKNGKLTATFHTNAGKFDCTLFEDETPLTVANFVGLARGVRPWYDKKADKWMEKEPYYKDVLFFRVIKNFMLQTGDRTNSGTGNPGFTIVDEIDKKLKHNKAGILSMANRGPNTGSSQFFITVKATPHLDGKHTVFGQCKPKVAVKISQVKVQPQFNNRPVEPQKIEKIVVKRK